jgi:hypothetical protein
MVLGKSKDISLDGITIIILLTFLPDKLKFQNSKPEILRVSHEHTRPTNTNRERERERRERERESITTKTAIARGSNLQIRLSNLRATS